MCILLSTSHLTWFILPWLKCNGGIMVGVSAFAGHALILRDNCPKLIIEEERMLQLLYTYLLRYSTFPLSINSTVKPPPLHCHCHLFFQNHSGRNRKVKWLLSDTLHNIMLLAPLFSYCILITINDLVLSVTFRRHCVAYQSSLLSLHSWLMYVIWYFIDQSPLHCFMHSAVSLGCSFLQVFLIAGHKLSTS